MVDPTASRNAWRGQYASGRGRHLGGVSDQCGVSRWRSTRHMCSTSSSTSSAAGSTNTCTV